MMLTESEWKLLGRTLKRCQSDTYTFVRLFFQEAFPNWQGGRYILDCCERLDKHDFLVEITGRGFWKSSRFHAEIAKEIFTAEKRVKIFYFSFNQSMSSSHLKEVKEAVKGMLVKHPELERVIKDNKPTAESVIDYSNAFGGKVEAQAFGFGEFFRGLHTDDIIYIDDPLQDPTNRLDPLTIRKAGETFRTQIVPIANPVSGVRIRIGGTPQTNEDFFADEKLMAKFERFYLPAVKDEQSIWPERFSKEWLNARRNEIGDKAFRQEYLAEPVVAADAYIDAEMLDQAIDPDLKPMTDAKNQNIVCGFDPAKKEHSAHFAAYVLEEETGHLRQIMSKFWDKADYTIQLDWVNQFLDENDAMVCLADNTNGVLEFAKEEGRLYSAIKLVHFTAKRKQGLIQRLDAKVTAKTISLLPDERQRKHILSITNELKSIETDDGEGRRGHADAGWSNCLAICGVGKMDWLTNDNIET